MRSTVRFSDDTTALLLGTVSMAPHFDVLRVWERPAGDPAYRVPVAEVEQAIREACRRWQVVEIIADPFRWTRTLQALESERLPVVEFPHSPSRLTAATTDLYSAAMNGRITHSGNAVLAAHVAAAVSLKTPRDATDQGIPVPQRRQDRPGRLSGHGSLACHLARHQENTKEDKEFRMTQDELLLQLLQRLDEPAARYAELDRYYRGQQPLAFLSPEAKTALGNRFGPMASNIPRLAVTALAERLRVTGFTGDTELWADWIRCDLDQLSGVAHREALLLGDSYAIVWADMSGRPKVTVESAKQVAVQLDPGTRRITAAVKRWETKTTTEAVLYMPDQIVRLRANATGATTQGFSTVEELTNPLGVVPVVALRNSDRMLDDYGVQ